jgi:glycosyltransferase involved in cell wall biosynthesis
VIPCLDEARFIGRLVASVHTYLPHVLVVDDGSRDATADLAARAGADVMRHQASQGKGAALQAGFRRARERGFEWALAMDGDSQHAPEDIPKFFAAAERSGVSLVVGNRMGNPQGMPVIRRWTNRFMSRRLSRLTGRDLPDSQCGFRLLRLPAWRDSGTRATHFEFESDLLVSLARRGERIEFVPIQVIYAGERTKIRPLRDALRWFRWLRRARLR